jgi:hypothetical protein
MSRPLTQKTSPLTPGETADFLLKGTKNPDSHPFCRAKTKLVSTYPPKNAVM